MISRCLSVGGGWFLEVASCATTSEYLETFHCSMIPQANWPSAQTPFAKQYRYELGPDDGMPATKKRLHASFVPGPFTPPPSVPYS